MVKKEFPKPHYDLVILSTYHAFLKTLKKHRGSTNIDSNQLRKVAYLQITTSGFDPMGLYQHIQLEVIRLSAGSVRFYWWQCLKPEFPPTQSSA